MNSLYLSCSVLVSFDGASADAGTDAGAGAGAGAGAVGAGAGTNFQEPARFTQDDLNKYLAEDRRKHQVQMDKIQAKAQQALEEALASKNLTNQEREQLAQQLEDMKKETRTKEQQSAYERKELETNYEKKLTDERKSREEWENRYRMGTVERALQDAAVSGDAFNVGTVMAVLRPMTRLSEIMDEKTGKGTGKFKVVVDFPDTDPNTQEPISTLHTPESAVKRMKDLQTIYGNLFKSGVVSGIGSSAATGGLASGTSGKIDPKKLTQEQYMEIRAKNPALVGLRSQRGQSGR